MAQGAKQLYFLYNPIMKVLVMGFSFAHILIQGANYIRPCDILNYRGKYDLPLQNVMAWQRNRLISHRFY